jgi:hypothetical protein
VILLALALAPTRLPATDTARGSSLLVFPSVQGMERFDADRSADYGPYGEAIADVLYTRTRGRLRFLGELEFSNEYAEIDRLQFGWEPVPDSFIWLGKFHEPSSSWNFEHDHGHYLQTAISTPAIETPAGDRWGEDAGVLPENVTGMLVDSTDPIGESAAVQFSLGVGVSANPVQNSDRSYWIRPMSRGAHRIGWNARLALLPDYTRNNSFGLVASQHNLDTAGLADEGILDARNVDETIYGAYADGDWGTWTLHATIYHIDFNMRSSPHPRVESIVAGYAQLERRFAGRYTAFTRFENSARADDADFIQALQKRFELRRALLGIRWDFARHQAFTVELGRAATATDRFTKIKLQWSAVIQ